MKIIKKVRGTTPLIIALSSVPILATNLIVQQGVNFINNGVITAYNSSISGDGAIEGLGRVDLTGDKSSSVSGSISNLQIDKNGEVKLSKDLNISGELKLLSNLELNGFTINLGTEGDLIESGGAITAESGSITAMRSLSAESYKNVAGLGFSITPESELGVTKISRGYDAQKIGSLKRSPYFQIEPEFSALSKINFSLSDTYNSDEQRVRVFSSSNGEDWEQIEGRLDLEELSYSVETQMPGNRFTVVMNTPPVLQSVEDLTIAINEWVNIELSDLFAYDTDGDSLFIVLHSGENHSIDGTTIIPDHGFTGTLSVPVQVTDGMDSSEVLMIQLDVQPETAIVVSDIVTSSSTFSAVPNPVSIHAEYVTIVVPSGVRGLVHCSIYDVMGNLIDEQSVIIGQNESLSWDLRNRNGVKIASGSYLAILKTTLENGSTQMFKTLIGVQR